jgi:hypothetical protein
LIISTTSATGRTAAYFDFQVLTTGGSAAERLSVDTLPAGLTFDPVSGQISGTPESDGSSLVTLTATDGDQPKNIATLELTFTSDPAVRVIVSQNTSYITPGEFFSYQILVDGGTNLSYAVVGQLPLGLSLNPDTGVISGTPQLPPLDGQSRPDLTGGVITNVALYAIDSASGT